MAELFWLRSETKENEHRRPLVPSDCQRLIGQGHEIVVEDWADSIIPIEAYRDAGCEVQPAGSWMTEAPKNAIVTGLKALPPHPDGLVHRHIYFAHVFKKQEGYRQVLERFQKGKGQIIDLEYMVDENGRRTNAFGYWAGFVGAALAALFVDDEKLSRQEKIIELNRLAPFKQQGDLIQFVSEHRSEQPAKSIVIGASGRSGSGALDALNSLGFACTGWDRDQTAGGGPFAEILDFDLLVNCVLSMEDIPPFLTNQLLKDHKGALRMISDVSCDPDSDFNTLPIYDKATKLEDPVLNLSANPNVGLIAIDNLPAVLPKESSEDFSEQLTRVLLNYNEESGPIARSLQVFNEALQEIGQ